MIRSPPAVDVQREPSLSIAAPARVSWFGAVAQLQNGFPFDLQGAHQIGVRTSVPSHLPWELFQPGPEQEESRQGIQVTGADATHVHVSAVVFRCRHEGRISQSPRRRQREALAKRFAPHHQGLDQILHSSGLFLFFTLCRSLIIKLTTTDTTGARLSGGDQARTGRRGVGQTGDACQGFLGAASQT